MNEYSDELENNRNNKILGLVFLRKNYLLNERLYYMRTNFKNQSVLCGHGKLQTNKAKTPKMNGTVCRQI